MKRQPQTQHVMRQPKRKIACWKLRHENRRATKPVITPHAARLLVLLRG